MEGKLLPWAKEMENNGMPQQKLQKNIFINPFKLNCVQNTISPLFVFNVRCMFLEKIDLFEEEKKMLHC